MKRVITSSEQKTASDAINIIERARNEISEVHSILIREIESPDDTQTYQALNDLTSEALKAIGNLSIFAKSHHPQHFKKR